MGFLDSLSGQITNAGKDIKKKAADTAETMRLQNEIRANQTKIDKFCEELGKRVYEDIKDNPDEKYAYYVDNIMKLQERIEDDQRSLQGLKSVRVCPECGASVDGDSAFCTCCGTKLN
ncbi:hypothetical protein SAMN06296386_10644 [Lachnospiraceae bacterium]|nr:hypothetical protein SAMN06296386_10644 [Lachnospiraceae bacterium]